MERLTRTAPATAAPLGYAGRLVRRAACERSERAAELPVLSVLGLPAAAGRPDGSFRPQRLGRSGELGRPARPVLPAQPGTAARVGRG